MGRYRNNKDEGLETMAKREYEKVVVIPDTHSPYEDKQTYKTVLNFVRDQKPDKIVLIGDFIDMYSVSKYDKSPARAHQLQAEVDSASSNLAKLRAAAPKAKIVYIEGNHEARLQKYLWRHPELHGLANLELPALLGLKELKIDYVKEYKVKDTFLFTHGTKTNKYAARSELDAIGISGMSGHTHHVQSHMKTDYTGTKVWHSIGHIADPGQAEYTANPDWQQALGVVHFHKSTSRFFAEVIPITEHKFLYGGKIYMPDGVTKIG